jgi:hypothetical protein
MAVDDDWEHDKFPVVNLVAKGPQQHSFAGTKLLVSNLHHNVSSNDVKARRECSAAAAAQQPGCPGVTRSLIGEVSSSLAFHSGSTPLQLLLLCSALRSLLLSLAGSDVARPPPRTAPAGSRLSPAGALHHGRRSQEGVRQL